MSRYFDEWGNHLGYCNSCGEEGPLDRECCDDGEMVQHEDDEVQF